MPVPLAISNPFENADREAAPQAAVFLSQHNIAILAASDFGPKFISALEEGGITSVRKDGLASDVIRELIASV